MIQKTTLLLFITLFFASCKSNEETKITKTDLADFDLVDDVERVVESLRYFDEQGKIQEADPSIPEHFQSDLIFDENGLLIERKIIKPNGHIHEHYRYHGKDTLLSVDQYQNNELLFKTLYTYTAKGKLSKWEKKSTNGELIESRAYLFIDGKVKAEIRTNPGMQHEIRYEYENDQIVSEERWTNQRRKSKTTYVYNNEKQKIKEILYDVNNQLVYTATFEYESNKVVLEIYRNAVNEIIRKSTYIYDDNGNIIFQSKFENNSPEFIEQNSYNDQNQLIEQVVTENGVLIWQQNYTYDSKGKVIETTSFDGTKRETTSYQYEVDSKGNWIKRTTLVDSKPKQILSRKISYK
jgi:YD repeat-containing protein